MESTNNKNQLYYSITQSLKWTSVSLYWYKWITNRSEKTNLPCRKFQIIYVDTPPSRYSLFIKHKLCIMTNDFVPKSTGWKYIFKRLTLQWRNWVSVIIVEKLHNVSQIVKYNVNRDKANGQYILLIWCDENSTLAL